MKYVFIIDKIVQQIAIQRNGEDFDPSAVIAELNFKNIIADLENSDRIRLEEEKYKKNAERLKKVEKELAELKDGSSGGEGGTGGKANGNHFKPTDTYDLKSFDIS